MKNIKLFIIILFAVIFIPAKASAQTYNASNETLLRAFLSSGGDIVLTENITLTQNTGVNADATIDLNGKTLTMNNCTLIPYSKLTIKDTSSQKTGVITGGPNNYIIQVGSSNAEGTLILDSGKIDCSSKNYCVTIPAKGKFVINDGTVISKKYPIVVTGQLEINGGLITANNGGAVYGNTNGKITLNEGLIKIYTNDEGILLSKTGSNFTMNGGRIEAIVENSHDAVGVVAFKYTDIVINNGTIVASGAAIMGNGSVSGANEGTNANFTINGGTLTSLNELAIYAPSPNGVVTINGGTITGATSGIELRAGKLIVTGGTITGNTNLVIVSGNTNGSGITGAAVAVVQHDTKLPIDVKISGGTFNGTIPFMEANSLNNEPEYIALITYNITGGVFNSTGTQTVDIENFNGPFISGGTYTHNVTNYVKPGYGEKTKTANVDVLKIVNVTNTDDDASYTTGTILAGDIVSIVPNNKDGYDVLTIDVLDQNNNHIAVDDNNSFVSNENDVNINVVYAKTVITDNSKDLLITNNEQTKKTLYKTISSNNTLLESVANIDSTIELVIDEKEVTDVEKQEIINKIGSNNDIDIKLFDVYIIIKDENGNEIGRITELSGDIDLEFLTSSITKKLEKDYERKYYVVRNHNIYELINSNVSSDGTKLLFKSNKYSEFAIAYEDVKKPNNPDTNDNILSYITIFGLSTLMIIYLSKNKVIKNRI